MALLSKALKTNANATSAQVRETERWITKMQNATGVADGELRPALAALVAVTKDTDKAQSLLAVAMDISAAKGKPLEAVTAAIAKAQLGNVGALGRLGVATKDAEGKTLSFTDAMKNAKDTYGGAAATAADTTAGKMAILKAKIADLSESIGTQLIPIVEKVVDFIGRWADKFNNLSPAAQKVIVIVGLVLAAIGPLLIILGHIITIAPLVGAAFTAMTGPVGIVIVAIAAIVAAFVLLWKKCDWFRNFWIAVWDEVKVVFEAVWPVIKKVLGWIVEGFTINFRIIKAAVKWFWDWAGPFITEGIKTWWRIIKQVMSWIVDAVRTAWPIIKGVVETNIETIKRVIDGVKSVAKVIGDVWRAIRTTATNVWDDITGVVSGALDNIKRYANSVIGVINWVINHVPGLKGNVANIPTFGGGSGGGSVAPIPTHSSTSPTRSTPKIMDNGGMGADDTGGTHGGGRGGLGGDTAQWIKDIWDKFNIFDKLPSPTGGLWGGATSGIYGMAKSAIIGLLKKFGLGDRQKIVDFAKSRLGDPYVWGGSAPGGFDCSGLPYWAYMQAGHPIPRIPTYGGTQISRGAIQPADIMFYYPGAVQGGQRVPFGHFKMYAGGGQTIESASGGVQMRTADWGGAVQIRSYLATGGITRGLSIAGEAGPEAVVPLTNARRGAAVLREAGLVPGGGSVILNDNSRLTINLPPGLSAADARAIAAREIGAFEARKAAAKSAAARGRVRV